MLARTTNTYLIVTTLWLFIFVIGAQIMILPLVLPEIKSQLDVSDAALGWPQVVYSFMMAVTGLIAGPISDRFGRRPILLWGGGLMSVSLLLHGLAVEFELLVLFRGLSGVAAGIFGGAMVAYVGDYFPPQRRGVINGAVLSGLAAGQVVGMPVGKVLAYAFSFATPFVALGGVMAVASVLMLCFVPQPAVTLSREPLSIGGSLRRYATLLNERSTRGCVLWYFTQFFGLFTMVYVLFDWLQLDPQGPGLSARQVAWAFVAMGIASIIGALVSGRVSDRVGRKPVILFCYIPLIAMFALASWWMQDMNTVLVWFFVAMLLASSRQGAGSAWASELVTAERRGILLSGSVAVGQIGSALGAAVAALVYARLDSAGFVLNTLIAAVVGVAMVLIVAFMLPETRQVKEG